MFGKYGTFYLPSLDHQTFLPASLIQQFAKHWPHQTFLLSGI